MQRTTILTALALVCLTAATAATPNFSARHDYPGYFTTVANATDVNGDGFPDLVGLNSGHQIQILLGDGTGSFHAGPTSVSGMNVGGIYAVAVADVNGDGKPDVIIAGDFPRGTDGIGVCLGDGDGTFQPAVFTVGGKSMGSIVVGDFNGDGVPDVAAVGSGGVWLFAGNGNGTFQTPVMTPFDGYWLHPMVAADLNGDGFPDVVVPTGRGFAVFLNGGNGTLQPQQNFSGAPGNVAVGDINQDGHPDVVVASADSNYAHVYLGDGAGGFASPTQVFLPEGPDPFVAVGDLNGDGIPDLVNNNVDVALGKGGGIFGKPINYAVIPPSRNGPFHVLLADLRNDGRLDIVEQDGGNMVSVMLNNGQGRFQDGRFVPVIDGAGLPVTADYNGDGKPDLAVTATGQGITILLGTGSSDSLFTTGVTLPITNEVFSLVTGDLNGDGIPDLLAAVSASSGSVINAYLGNGDGTFTQKSSTAVPNDGLLVVGDFNHDGKLDFATSTGQLALGNGDGTFQTPVEIVAGSKFNWAAAGDLNADGWPDLVFTEATSNSIYILINNQHGEFKQSIISTAAYEQGPYIVVLGDLNGDGIPDAAVAFNTDISSGLGIFFGDGHGGFAYQQTLYDALGAVGPIIIQDVNGDGISDIVFCEFLGSVAVFEGIGNGTFQAPVYFGPAWGSNGMALGNFNGQAAAAGTPDIVVNTFGGVVALLNTTR